MRPHASNSTAPSLLHYTVRPCAWGLALVAATERGIAAVLLGDDRTALIADLQQRFARAQLDTGGALLHRWSDVVLGALAHPSAALVQPVPLDMYGTAFQQQVWQLLRSIPAGQTRSYSAVAQALGQPQAVRAVASACGANPVAVLVPCHRVLRSDGGLGGYRWGLQRKQQLLAHEARIAGLM